MKGNSENALALSSTAAATDAADIESSLSTFSPTTMSSTSTSTQMHFSVEKKQQQETDASLNSPSLAGPIKMLEISSPVGSIANAAHPGSTRKKKTDNLKKVQSPPPKVPEAVIKKNNCLC